MRCPTRRRALVSTATAAVVLGAAPPRAARPADVPRPEPTPACSLELVPESVAAGRPDTRILAESSVAARGRPRVETPPESGIRVRGVRPDVSEGSWVLRLDLTDARAGAWRLALRGEGFRCAGELTVREPAGAW